MDDILSFLLFFLFFLFIGFIVAFCAVQPRTVKVKELERGSVFCIDSVSYHLRPGDTVWVNLTSRRVDPGDSTAMLCVIQ